jgi:arylsulfatase A-like enzyme
VTNLTTDFAMQWLDRRDTTRPFFLVCNQKAPHRNWMPEQKYLHLFDSTDFPVPVNYFDDYSGRGRAAREQEMEVATDMHPHWDLKLGLDLPAGERGGLSAGWQNAYNRLSQEEKAGWTMSYGPVIDAYRARPPQGKDLAIWKYQRYMRDYMRCVQTVDDNVGRLMEYLKDKGLDRNTIVIYTSDQGFYLGEHGWFDKRFMYEESFRTPLIVRWPGVTDRGLKSASMVQNIDMAETLLEMAGLSIPSDMQGRSMVPVLTGKQKGNLHDGLYYHFYENQEHRVAKHFGIRTDRYKLIYFYELGEWEMYDLKKDPSEMRNLAGDPSQLRVLTRLKKDLSGLVESYDDPDARAALKSAR